MGYFFVRVYDSIGQVSEPYSVYINY
jgi:hypothetical protein